MIQLPPVVGHPHRNVHLIANIFRPVGGQHQAIGYQPNRTADAQHIGTESSGRLTIHIQAPLDPGQAPVVFNIDKTTEFAHAVLNAVDIAIQLCAVHTADLQLDGLAFSRAALLLAELQFNTGDICRTFPKVFQNIRGSAAGVPVRELELQNADHIRSHLGAGGHHGARIQGLYLRHILQPRLHFTHNGIPFPHRKIATSPHLNLGRLGLDTREKLDTMVKAPIGGVDHKNHHQGAEQGQARALQKSGQHLSVAPHETPFTGILLVPATTAHATQNREKNQRHGQRSNQADQHGHRQVFHEFAHHSGPEQQRHEDRKRRRRGGNNRPGHARGCFHPGGFDRLPVRQIPVCQLRHHNGAIHQHARHEDQAEQHDDIERQAHAPDHQDAGQKRPGDGEPHQHS